MKRIIPSILVSDVEKTLDYYTQDLGFIFLQSLPSLNKNDKVEWAMIKHGEVTLMLQALKNKQKISKGVSLYIELENIEELYDTYRLKEVEIVSDIATTFYGTLEFSIVDINGYVLTFFKR